MSLRGLWLKLVAIVLSVCGRTASEEKACADVPRGESWLRGPCNSFANPWIRSSGMGTCNTHPLLASYVASKTGIPVTEVVFFLCRMGLRDYSMLLSPSRFCVHDFFPTDAFAVRCALHPYDMQCTALVVWRCVDAETLVRCYETSPREYAEQDFSPLPLA